MHNQSTSDASRLTQLINDAMGSVVIDMQPNVQQICNTLISARPDYLMLVNAQGQIRFASDACEDLVGIAGAALEDHTFDSLLVAEDRHSYQHFMNESVIPLAGSSFSKLGPLDLRVRIAGETKPEAFRWVALRIASVDLLRGSNQQHALFFFSLMDITHRELEEERILRQLNFDALTGLPSRYNIMSTVEKHIELSDEGAPFVFVFFDLDRFKTVNDALGHRIGDEFLSSICQRLNRWLDNAHIFARFGGDEFILFLPSMSDLEEAKALCLRALDLMREPMDVAGYTLSCGASFGLARYPDHGTTIDALIQAADTAMYHTKSLGTGGCAVFDESMNAERFSQIELEQEMREALAQQAFLAFYQPCVDLVTGEIVAVEALARWQHKRRGLLNPHDFLALANQAGLVAEIDAQVQQSALQQAAAWRDAGFDLLLSINCSSVQIESADFLPKIESMCAAAGYPLERLQLEITEQTLVRQVELAAANIQSLRAKGVRVAIDDFGMGYSSLTYLRQFPVDVLKIDRTFIQDIQTLAQARVGVSLADAIIAMAKSLGLELIAEGVEYSAQISYLRQQACDMAQGYLFSEPCDAAQMQRLMDQEGFAHLLEAALPIEKV
jgi:diguanylate cyclase (GGDEF)-like protein